MNNPDSLPKVIGGNARRLRREAGATLEQMAAALEDYGVNWSTGRVGDLESGRVAASIPTVVAVSLALSALVRRPVAMVELFEHAAPVRINDQLTLREGGLHAVFVGEQLTWKMVSAERSNATTLFASARDEFGRMKRFAERYGEVNLDLIQRAERVGLAEKRAAEDLGVKAGTIAHAAAYMWRRTFTEERDHRAGRDATPQRLGQVTRQMKSELRSAFEELGRGDD